MTKVEILQNNYINAINDYIKAFEIKQEVDCEPSDVDMLYFDCQNFCISFHDIKYDIDNDVKKGLIFKYYDYFVNECLDGQQHWVNYPNYVKHGANLGADND